VHPGAFVFGGATTTSPDNGHTMINTPVQGTAADIMKIAMVRADREIRSRGLATRMILTVHDELLFDVPRGELEEASALVRECMEGAMQLRVPLKVETGSGANWLEAH